MKKATKILLLLIFILALFLRFWKLDIYPQAVDEDEMALGYEAFALIHGGVDEYGHKLPIYFESAGDYKYGLYSYLDTIPVFLFGLNPTTTRSVSAVAGSLSVVAIFFLAYEIFKKEEYGLLSAFVLALNSTHIHFSRVAYNNILGALFAIVSITLFIKWSKSGGFRYLLASFLTFVLAIFSYQAYRLFLPISFILIFIFLFSVLSKKRMLALLFTALVVITTLISFVSPQSRARSQSISILIDQPMLTEQISEDGLSGSSIFVSRLFHNKVANFVLGTANRYFSYFDPSFLFVQTSVESQRHSIPNVGLLYLIEAPFLLLGLMFLGKTIPGSYKFVPLVLLFVAPVPATAVLETQNTTRSVVITFAFSLLIALGLYILISQSGKLKKYLLVATAGLYFFSLAYFFHQYTVNKIFHHPWYSDVGLKEMAIEVTDIQSKYQAVVMSHGHYIPYLYYNQVLPQDFIKDSVFANEIPSGGVPVVRYKNIYFNMPYECPTAGERNVLYVCFGYQVPKFAKLIDVIRYKDGQPAIELVEFTGIASSEKLPEKLEYSKDWDIRFPNGILPNNYETFWPTQ